LSGVEQPLPITEGGLYIEYREWLNDIANFIKQVVTNADIELICGPIDPDNPVGWGASKAVANANGSVVFVCGVADPLDDASWEDTLAAISNVSTLYNLAPLTQDPDVGALFKQHVDDQSDPDLGESRTLWFNLVGNTFIPLITEANTTDLAVALGTLTHNPPDPVSSFRLFTCTTANAKFVTNDVRPGDTVKYQFNTDAWGDETWIDYIVESVVNEDQLILVSGTAIAIGVAQKFEIWRTLTNAETTDDLIAQRQTYNDRRVQCVWPDQADGLPGYYICAALAGEASGISSNQGMRNTQLVGFIDMSRALNFLSAGNIARLTQNGVWVVTQDSFGINYSKSAVTSVNLPDVLQNTEEMIVRNADGINFYVLESVASLIGASNVVPGTLAKVRGLILSALNLLKSRGVTGRLGPAIIAFQITDIRVHVILKDRIVVTIEYVLPAPLNAVVVTSTIVI
jgi:hypothetical protein